MKKYKKGQFTEPFCLSGPSSFFCHISHTLRKHFAHNSYTLRPKVREKKPRLRFQAQAGLQA